MKLRNAALYVGFGDGEFLSPADRIPKETAAAISSFNSSHLADKRSMVKLVKRWREFPDNGEVEVSNMLEALLPLEVADFENINKLRSGLDAALSHVRPLVASGMKLAATRSSADAEPKS
jgi:hypothetical protein